MRLRRQVNHFQDVNYNFHMIERLLMGMGLDGDNIRDIPWEQIKGLGKMATKEYVTQYDMHPTTYEFILETVTEEMPVIMPFVVTHFCEHIVVDWNSAGFEFQYSRAYPNPPAITTGLQGYEVDNELNTYSFNLVAEHIQDGIGDYTGAKITPQGTDIPGNEDFSGSVVVTAICNLLDVEEEE